MKPNTCIALLSLAVTSVSFADPAPANVEAQALPAKKNATEVDCFANAVSFRKEIAAQPSLVLAVVEKSLRLHSSCACEIVKSAIEATNADVKLIGSIVEVVALTAPEQLRISAQCAIAVAPDALDEVQLVLAKYDPAMGESGLDSAKGGAKGGTKDGAKEGEPQVAEELPNPLDFPGTGNENSVNLSPNSPGGSSGWGIGVGGDLAAVAAGAGNSNTYGNRPNRRRPRNNP